MHDDRGHEILRTNAHDNIVGRFPSKRDVTMWWQTKMQVLQKIETKTVTKTRTPTKVNAKSLKLKHAQTWSWVQSC